MASSVTRVSLKLYPSCADAFSSLAAVPETKQRGGGGAAGEGKRSQLQVLATDLAALWRHPVYVVTILGTSVYTGASPSLETRLKCGRRASRPHFDAFTLSPVQN